MKITKKIKVKLNKLGVEKGNYKHFIFSARELEKIGSWDFESDFSDDDICGEEYDRINIISKKVDETDVCINIYHNEDGEILTTYGFIGGNHSFSTGDDEGTIDDVITLMNF